MFRTLNFKIKLDDETRYLELMEIVGSVFNMHTEWAYEKKSWNGQLANKDLYYQIKEKYPNLPTGLIQTTRNVAMESVKRGKFKCKRPICKSKYMTVRYDVRTISRHGTNSFTLSTLDKRQKIWIETPNDENRKDIFLNWKFKSASVSFCKKTKQFWIHLQFEKETPQSIKNTNKDNILGVDLGIHNLVTTSDPNISFGSKKLRSHQRQYLFLKSKLQAKGTASAKRHLKRLSGKQMRFSKDLNHQISKNIVNSKYDIFVFEDLSGIRSKKHFSKKLNNWISHWAYSQLQSFVQYKSEAIGKMVVKVDPAYTSQTCSNCGEVKKQHRFKSHFKCSKCGFIEHADFNAALNIRNRFILSSSETTEEQAAVNQPIVTVGM